MIEVVWLLLGVAFDVLAEVWYWRWLFAPIERRAEPHPAVVVLGIACLGVSVGAVATWVWPARIVASHGPAGMSLVLIPILNGVVMGVYGEWRQWRGDGHSSLATLWGGAAFGLGFAAARFLLVDA